MKYKIIHIYIVDGKNREEALGKFADAVKAGKEDNFFETEVVKKLEEDPGWMGTLKTQLTGRKF